MTPASEFRADLDPKARLFRGLADLSRLSVLESLRDGPLSVNQVVGATGLSQSNVSNHLACLLGCGLVSREARGRFAFYSLAGPQVEALLSLSQLLLSETATGVASCDHCAVEGADGERSVAA